MKERQFRSSDVVRSISVLSLVMALPWESNSKEVLSKNKSVYENAVTGIQWSCILLLITFWLLLLAGGSALKLML